jgi:hypothetical protein
MVLETHVEVVRIEPNSTGARDASWLRAGLVAVCRWWGVVGGIGLPNLAGVIALLPRSEPGRPLTCTLPQAGPDSGGL